MGIAIYQSNALLMASTAHQFYFYFMQGTLYNEQKQFIVSKADQCQIVWTILQVDAGNCFWVCVIQISIPLIKLKFYI